MHLYLPSNFFFPELPGGSLQYLRYAPYLRDRGIKITVLTTLRPEHKGEKIEAEGLEIRRIPGVGDGNFLEDLLMLADFAAREIASRGLRRQACIQPIGTFAFTPRSVAKLARIRLAGIPLFRHFTEVPEIKQAGILRMTRRRLVERVGLSPYNRLLMCSHTMGRTFQELAGIGAKRIAVIPNGIDRKIFHPIDPTFKSGTRTRLGLPDSGPIVLSVCSVIPRKGVDLLIKAWQTVLDRCPSASLVIVGSNHVRSTFDEPGVRDRLEEYLKNVQELVSNLSNPKSVIFTGEVSNVEDYYQASDLFVFASHKEGLPSAVLEAMSSGLPSVLAPFHGFPDPGEEYGTPGSEFLAVSHDPASIASALIHLLGSPEARTRLGASASMWIESTQSIEKAADRLARVYHSAHGGC
ncbi:MAG: glycosyltransferase family 4 protein [Verrucomicrobiae bacterium]|nr:glycosyltransferase family 4 protein [Verrucomicrobiae bacterium]